MPELGTTGKGIYIWQAGRIGGPSAVAEALVRSRTDFVAIKIHNGALVWENLEPHIDEIRRRGIAVGAWGYVYLRFNPLAEARAALEAIRRYQPDFYLIDAEAEAKLQYVPARLFATALRSGTNIPLGLNSYWYPPYHPSLPWKELRSVCDFDAPQVYWRGARPVAKLCQSKEEYARLKPRLPFAMPAGDLYIDRNIKPTPQQVLEYLAACRRDSEIQSALMWSMDQKDKVPELWSAYAGFDWATGEVNDPGSIPVPPAMPLYTAVVTAWGLNVRPDPSTKKPPLGVLKQGERVDVFGIEHGWAWIDDQRKRWVSNRYIKRV